MDKCSICNDEVRFYGYCSCQEDDGFSFPALLAIVTIVLSFMYVFFQWYTFGSTYVPGQDKIIGIVQGKEAAFLRDFNDRVKRNPNLNITGWKCDRVIHWGLVTYHYTASKGKDKPLERRAYFWAVNTKTNEIYRLESLKQFVEKYLLTQVPMPAKG